MGLYAPLCLIPPVLRQSFPCLGRVPTRTLKDLAAQPSVIFPHRSHTQHMGLTHHHVLSSFGNGMVWTWGWRSVFIGVQEAAWLLGTSPVMQTHGDLGLA
ncbi:unnamed protein product [Microthlaspi erraticum]|uniref:Uncharacterized protein n=1 Tax=Microthlaspi erraticum TaxID=1685480 RepID=A0A6D2JCF3_9BRAS|nr:unnamed protein product [Microthlaspi erraticum]